jgi:hypothetical protein
MMRSVFSSALVRAAAAVMLTIGVMAPESAAKPLPGRPIRRGQLNLFASNGLLFEVNRQQCGLQADGQTCVAFAGSPVGGGGFWPKGTPDQYIFNSGLQIAGHVSRTAGFAWAGDTVGAFFMDARGDQFSGSPAPGTGGWYNSLNPADIAAWPNGAVVRNARDSIYSTLVEGAQTISQGDAWARYWEGDPAFSTGRPHPSGLLVDQRALAWNFPSGNEDIIYFVFTFYNITARSTSGLYNNPTIPGPVQAEIASFGDQFQDLNENKFKLDVPDGGYALDSIYAAFTMDADVAVFSQNYTTAWLPFNIGGEYTGTFLPEVGWTFPPSVFGAPFFAGAGFIGVKYLKSPESSPGVQVGLTMFSQTLNSATGFPDPVGVNQLLRYLSGFHGPTDLPCSFSDLAVARLRRLCFLGQGQGDARFFEASGPFNLAPGQATSIVVAYINAAPVAVSGTTPGPTTDVKPMTPFTGDSIFANPGDTIHVRRIDRMAGWVSATDINGNSSIDQDEVTTVPRSLLNKGLVAQDVFDHGFLLPNSPKAPEFYLVPGDGQVTVVWQKSSSEATGDPYFAVASDPTIQLYDPNFRQFDVEGYRVYRGRTSSDLSLVAQFDYAGTSFIDYTAALPYGDFCAPELGVTTSCPVLFDSVPPKVTGNEVDIAGDLIQIPPGGRVKLANGSVLVLAADTAVTGAASGAFPVLENTGVPFAFVDRSVRNSFSYFYTVTAFDVNSFKSGPTSLESPRITKRVTPRGSVPNLTTAELSFGVFGDDNVELDPSPAYPIDAATGRFTGPPPPSGAGALAAAFAPLVPQLLPALNLTFQVDSVKPNSDVACDGGAATNLQDICFTFFVSFTRGATTTSFQSNVFWPIWTGFGEPSSNSVGLGAFPVVADSASSAGLGVPPGFAQFNASVQASLSQYILFSAQENQAGRRLTAQVSPGGSRWFDGADETLNDPATGRRVGHVAGVDTIFAPLSHVDLNPVAAGVQTDDNLWAPFVNGNANTIRTNMQCWPYVVGALGRQADIELTWGAGGTVTTVRDVTDHVNVPFKATPQASYGFIGDVNGNGKIDWQDFDELDGVAQHEANIGFCITPVGAALGLLVQQPVITAVSTNGGTFPAPFTTETSNPANFATTGTGFGIYINGQRFIFQLTGGTPPAAGTKWTLRSYAGFVRATTGADGLDPSGYTITGTSTTSAPPLGSPAIPGLRVVFNVTSATVASAESDSVLDHVHSVPDPYYVTDALEITANQKILKFVNLPPQAIIRIYSLSGVLVNVITHNDPGLGGEESWNLRNRNNQFVASGVYFYQVETPAGHKKLGRFTIVNFAP